MEKSTKIVLGILAVIVLALAIKIPGWYHNYNAANKRFDEAMANRTPPPGSQAAEAAAAMEDIRRATPTLTPEQERAARAMTQAPAGGMAPMEVMMAAEDIRDGPQARRDAALRTMLTLMESQDVDDRRMAIQTLARLKDNRAIPNVFNHLHDQDTRVQGVARRTLQALGYPIQ
jgi:hypothetical protein